MPAKPGITLLAAVALASLSSLISGCKSHATPPHLRPPPIPAAAPAPVIDACQVLTPAEISSALGVPIDTGKGSNVICFWSQTGRPGDSAVKLVLNFSQVAVFNREKAASGNVTVTPAPGIGDDAIFVRSQLGTSLLNRNGATSIGVAKRNKRLPQAALMARERALGLAAAARI